MSQNDNAGDADNEAREAPEAPEAPEAREAESQRQQQMARAARLMVQAGKAPNIASAMVALGYDPLRMAAAVLAAEASQPYVEGAVEHWIVGDRAAVRGDVHALVDCPGPALASACWSWAREALRYGIPLEVGIATEDGVPVDPADLNHGIPAEVAGLAAMHFTRAAIEDDLARCKDLYLMVTEGGGELLVLFVMSLISSAATVRKGQRA